MANETNFNGTLIDGFEFNGVDLDEAYMNGDLVFKRFVLADNIPNQSNTQTSPASSRSGNRFLPDGSSLHDNSDGSGPSGSWGLPATTGIGSSYDIRFIYGAASGGSPAISAPSSGTWTFMSGVVTFSLTNNSSSDSTSSLSISFSIRLTGGGATVLTGSFSLSSTVAE